MKNRSIVNLALCVSFLMLAFTAQSAHAQNSLIWDASGERNGVKMEATYSELYFGDLVDQEIEVRVWNAPPLTRLKIFVRGTAIGVVETNSFGYGRFFKGRLGVALDDLGRPDAPRVEDGNLIEVGKKKGNRFISGNFVPR